MFYIFINHKSRTFALLPSLNFSCYYLSALVGNRLWREGITLCFPLQSAHSEYLPAPCALKVSTIYDSAERQRLRGVNLQVYLTSCVLSRQTPSHTVVSAACFGCNSSPGTVWVHLSQSCWEWLLFISNFSFNLDNFRLRIIDLAEFTRYPPLDVIICVPCQQNLLTSASWNQLVNFITSMIMSEKPILLIYCGISFK